MELKDIATIAGKPGLYKILKPTKTGFIVEAINEKRNKLVVSAHQRISILKEISIYVTSAEDSVAIEDVFLKIKDKHNGENVDVKVSDTDALRNFMESILEDYDKERVYPSDIKKIVNWYNTLISYFPDLFEVENVAEPAEKPEESEEEVKSEEK